MYGNGNIRRTSNVEDALQYAGMVALRYGSFIVDTQHLLYGILWL